jgi:biopolymer transport protein ExbD
MRFKSQRKSAAMPEVNLVPMMDVIMTILTFFIILSMTLRNGQSVLDVNLPQAGAGVVQEENVEPLIIELNAQGQMSVAGQAIEVMEWEPRMRSYLEANPQGSVLLMADQSLSYGNIVEILGKMKQVGGDRVSLAIESP